MSSDLISKLIGCLEHLADRPDLYRKLVPPGHELSYISGVGFGARFGFGLAGDGRERELRHAAALARGWAIDRHPYEQMLDRGFSADEILSELARLEAEFVRLASKPA